MLGAAGGAHSVRAQCCRVDADERAAQGGRSRRDRGFTRLRADRPSSHLPISRASPRRRLPCRVPRTTGAARERSSQLLQARAGEAGYPIKAHAPSHHTAARRRRASLQRCCRRRAPRRAQIDSQPTARAISPTGARRDNAIVSSPALYNVIRQSSQVFILQLRFLLISTGRRARITPIAADTRGAAVARRGAGTRGGSARHAGADAPSTAPRHARQLAPACRATAVHASRCMRERGAAVARIHCHKPWRRMRS